MADHLSQDPIAPIVNPAPAPVAPVTSPDISNRPSRYDANLQLIRRRLADELRMSKSRKWWKNK
jgi:hypothetical protein